MSYFPLEAKECLLFVPALILVFLLPLKWHQRMNSFASWVILHAFCLLYQKCFQEFQEPSVSNSLDLDQVQHFTGLIKSPNCLQMLSQASR